MAKISTTKLKILNFIAGFVSFARALRYLFYAYSGLSFILCFVNLTDIDLSAFNWLFTIPYQIVSKFYSPNGMDVDFSLLFIGFIALFLGFIYDTIVVAMQEKILIAQEDEDRKIHQLRQREEAKRREARLRAEKRRKMQEAGGLAPIRNTSAQGMPTIQEIENSKLLFLILPHINKIKRSENELELTFQDVEIWKQRVNKKLIENIIYSKPTQKGYYRKNLFLVYKDFNYADEFIYYIQPTLASIMMEFKKYRIAVSFSYVLSSLSMSKDLEKELDCMDTILSLNFINECIVTNRFKI
ncbi:hypothetical protein II906_10780, partial [bacterium]|nr:hypothetical protein [bacterium]